MSKKKKSPSPSGSPSSPARPFAKAAGAGSLLLTREGPEPRSDDRPTPVWLIVLLGLLLWWGEMFVMEHGGDLAGKTGTFPATVYSPFKTHAEVVTANPFDATRERAVNGLRVYNLVCNACHQASGMGSPGQFPPLAGSEWVLAESPNRIVRIVLHGLIGPIDVKGQQFNGNMVAWKDTLTDEQIADVLTYIRSEWGNKAPAVSTEQVQKIRGEVGDRGDYWTVKELEAVP